MAERNYPDAESFFYKMSIFEIYFNPPVLRRFGNRPCTTLELFIYEVFWHVIMIFAFMFAFHYTLQLRNGAMMHGFYERQERWNPRILMQRYLLERYHIPPPPEGPIGIPARLCSIFLRPNIASDWRLVIRMVSLETCCFLSFFMLVYFSIMFIFYILFQLEWLDP